MNENRNKLLMKYPASWHGEMWREAIPVGNGEIGGMVYGGAYKEVIALTHSKLWTHGRNEEIPDVSYKLSEMRELLKENKPIEAERVIKDELERKGYSAKHARPYPVCDIELIMQNHDRFKKYTRVLDMETAEASVNWQDGETKYSRKFFVSRNSDVACLKITAENGFANIMVGLKLHDEDTITDEYRADNIEYNIRDSKLYYSGNIEGKDFGAVLKVCHNGKERINYHRFPMLNKLAVEDATEILIFVKLFIYGERNKDWKLLEEELENVNDYDAEFRASSEIHKSLFSKMNFSLGGKDYDISNEELLFKSYGDVAKTELIEKMWSFGRYLLICATRKGGQPCNLYGLWHGYNPIWAYNMFNVNAEMIHWQAVNGNMPEILLTMFDYVEEKMDDFRENAKKIYGCRGIFIPSVSTPESGLCKDIDPHILHWTAGAGWVSQFFFDYYLCTKDVEFLKNRAMPFMKETMDFYEDFLTIDENGYFVSSPSNSPENTPKNVFDIVRKDCEITVNATMDFAIIKEVLTNLIKGAEITGAYSEKINVWRDMLEKVPPYQLNPDNTVREWMHPFYEDRHEHRHMSQLYPLFPGYEITRYNNKSMCDAFLNTVMSRKNFGLKDQTGWSLVYMSNIFVRLGKGKEVMECIDCIASANILPNFLTVHNDWRRMGVAICLDMRQAPIQLDANIGLTSSLNEMLAFSTQEEIYLFNGLDFERFKSGSCGQILTRCGLLVSVEWDENGATAVIENKNGDKPAMLHVPENMVFTENMKSDLMIEPNFEGNMKLSIKFN